MASYIITGVNQVDRALKQLPPAVARKMLRKSFRQALKPLQAEVKANAPRKTGQLAKAIKVRAGKRKRGTIALNVQIGEGDFKGDEFYGAFQEYGFHLGKRGAANRPKIEGKHFMKDAFEHQKDTVRDTAVTLTLQNVNEAVKELRAAGS